MSREIKLTMTKAESAVYAEVSAEYSNTRLLQIWVYDCVGVST